jgi:hypothetical protein
MPELVQLDQARLDALVASVRREVESTLGAYREGAGLAVPMAVHIAVGWT